MPHISYSGHLSIPKYPQNWLWLGLSLGVLTAMFFFFFIPPPKLQFLVSTAFWISTLHWVSSTQSLLSVGLDSNQASPMGLVSGFDRCLFPGLTGWFSYVSSLSLSSLPGAGMATVRTTLEGTSWGWRHGLRVEAMSGGGHAVNWYPAGSSCKREIDFLFINRLLIDLLIYFWNHWLLPYLT